jgi:ubiquinone/menaquinone biosynthesis C-methylase UbiE
MTESNGQKVTDKPMGSLQFFFMSLVFKLRDRSTSPLRFLEEASIRPGDRVLDYGCGPGSYSIAVAELVGNDGEVLALDIYSRAVETVQRKAAGRGLSNVETMCAADLSALKAESFDRVLLYDTFHMLGDQRGVLEGVHRVLKPQGLLSFSDHHMKEADILQLVTQDGLFSLVETGKHTYLFARSAGS